MIPEALRLLTLLWPVSVVSLVICFVAGLLFAINVGSFVLGILYLSYTLYSYLKRNGYLKQASDWLTAKAKTMNSTLHTNLRKTFSLQGHVANLPEGPILYLAHPHGLFSMAPFLHWAAGCTEWPQQKKVHIAVHSIFFKIPIVCEVMEHFGAIEATEEEIKKKLLDGTSVAVLTGGIRELHETAPGKMRLVLKKRAGWVRIAKELQIPIVPILTFGENELFPPLESKWMQKVQGYLKHWFNISIPIPTFSSLVNWFTLLQAPLEPCVVTWIGKSIEPKKKTVNELQRVVFSEFEELYHKGKPAEYPDTLEIL